MLPFLLPHLDSEFSLKKFLESVLCDAQQMIAETLMFKLPHEFKDATNVPSIVPKKSANANEPDWLVVKVSAGFWVKTR